MRDIKQINYIDSTLINEQTEERARPTIFYAVGFVIEETDEYITLAREYSRDNQLRGQISIPKVAIIRSETKNK